MAGTRYLVCGGGNSQENPQAKGRQLWGRMLPKFGKREGQWVGPWAPEHRLKDSGSLNDKRTHSGHWKGFFVASCWWLEFLHRQGLDSLSKPAPLRSSQGQVAALASLLTSPSVFLCYNHLVSCHLLLTVKFASCSFRMSPHLHSSSIK